MSGYVARHSQIGAGTWLIAGAVVLGVGIALFSGVRAVGSLIHLRAPGGRVKMTGGSTSENLASLQAAFGPAVQDVGDGVYIVGVAQDVTAVVPGAKVI